MSVIYSTPTTERLSRRLAKAGHQYWVAATTGDAYGKYLLFVVGGKCVGSCGWNVRDAEDKVRSIIQGEGSRQ